MDIFYTIYTFLFGYNTFGSTLYPHISETVLQRVYSFLTNTRFFFFLFFFFFFFFGRQIDDIFFYCFFFFFRKQDLTFRVMETTLKLEIRTKPELYEAWNKALSKCGKYAKAITKHCFISKLIQEERI